MRVITSFLTLALVVFATGCTGEQPESEESPTQEAALPQGLLLDEAPVDAMGIAELKMAKLTGEDVTITGLIGGQVAPFVENRAMFTMTDLKLPMCDIESGDTCKTPWDSCCETPESIRKNMITVQVVDTDGNVVHRDLNGYSGIVPMAQLTVRGKVRQHDGEVLILDAHNIYVHKDSGKLN